MTDKTIHQLIAQQVTSIMKAKGITSYRLMQEGINQSNLDAVLQKKDVSYGMHTLLKILNHLEVKELRINFEDGTLVVLG